MSGYVGGCENSIRCTHCNGIAQCLSQPGDAPPCPHDTGACGDYQFEACGRCLDDAEAAMWREVIYISQLDLSTATPNRPPNRGASRPSTHAPTPTGATNERHAPEKATALRKPFPPESVGRLSKGGVRLDYVGHTAVTDRLLAVDPNWSWKPFAIGPDGLPALDRANNLWIGLTIWGVTQISVGDGKSAKECIGDAIRNAARRFGVALDLWAKEDLVEFAQAASGHRVARVVPGTSDDYDDDDAALNTGNKLAKAMYAAINNANVHDRIANIGDVIGRNNTATKEMTEDDAHRDLDDLAVPA
jgi:hypothetical protein